MKTNIHAIISAAVLGLLSTAFIAHEQNDTYTGYAYAEGKKQVYKEELTERFVNGSHKQTVSEYFDAGNKLIAKRTMDFSTSKFAPNFKTEDLRTGYIEGASVDGNAVKLFVKKNRTAPMEEKTIAVPQPMVIDGGFNAFIKAHWSELQHGEPLRFNFTVSSKLDYFKLRAARVSETGDRMTVRIEPDNAMIRWIATPIVVQYDNETHRLVSYEGKSNIPDEHGTNLIIKLTYPEKGL